MTDIEKLMEKVKQANSLDECFELELVLRERLGIFHIAFVTIEGAGFACYMNRKAIEWPCRYEGRSKELTVIGTGETRVKAFRKAAIEAIEKFPKIEDGWQPPQEPAEDSGSLAAWEKADEPETQGAAALQPEGELVPNPYRDVADTPNTFDGRLENLYRLCFYEGSRKARLKEPLFDSIEQQHIVQSLQAHYGAGWCAVCDSIIEKLKRAQAPIKEPPSAGQLQNWIAEAKDSWISHYEGKKIGFNTYAGDYLYDKLKAYYSGELKG